MKSKNLVVMCARTVFLFALAQIAALSLSYPAAAEGAGNDLLVNIATGSLRGARRAAGGAEFLGIPYAQPPVGDLRWHEPVAVKPWTGVRDATSFGAPCAQRVLGDWNKHDAETSNEDCLFLNVITPVWPPKTPLPVMFWIHGGANEGGTASSALYKDGTLVEHGVVLVTVNYRLGVFGFFAYPGLTRASEHRASGNYALLDLIAALHWVHDNIGKFGGDPNNITVFGQSAGAHNAGLLMVSPLSKDLFHRAILQSGTPLGPPPVPLAAAEQGGEKFAASLNLPAAGDPVKYLRQLAATDLLRASSNRDPNQPSPFEATVDGWVLPRSPAEVFASGQQSAVPMIIGTTTREFGMPGPPDAVRGMIQAVTGGLAPRVLPLYGLSDGGQGANDPMYGTVGNQWLADLFFRCPSTALAAWHTARSNTTYEYQLEHAIPGQESEGAVHSSDLPYVFGFYPKTGNISGKFGDLDYKIADWIERYWTSFAKTGDPNAGSLPDWPKFGTSQTFIEFTQDGRVLTSTGLRRVQCDVLHELLKRSLAPAK